MNKLNRLLLCLMLYLAGTGVIVCKQARTSYISSNRYVGWVFSRNPTSLKRLLSYAVKLLTQPTGMQLPIFGSGLPGLGR